LFKTIFSWYILIKVHTETHVSFHISVSYLYPTFTKLESINKI
jgi:hypothetical protein